MGYPPHIDSKLPAQVGSILKIPYQPSRATASNAFHCVIKTISTGSFQILNSLSIANNIAEFDISSLQNKGFIQENQYYKIQLADGNYNSTTTGITYSNVGVFKYIGASAPSINITYEDFSFKVAYNHNIERLYRYRFDLYNNGQLYETSGDLICNVNLHPDITTSVVYVPNVLIEGNIECKFTYQTVNGLSDFEIITTTGLKVNSTPSSDYIVQDNKDEGYNSIHSITNIATSNNLEFAKKKIGTSQWVKISAVNGNYFTSHESIKDFIIESGVKYQYGLLNDNSITYIGGHIDNDYWDMFLNDRERQLKIQFNPKISSFKNVILESKTDTIGGQYPVFFRNSQIKYKEFPISGLISYLTDPENLFDGQYPAVPTLRRGQTPADIESNMSPSTNNNLTIDNILREKTFRLNVLEWLSNGQPKLFRSATEGMYIVRLMNISLTPNDTLGRMIYTFSATAYEIADCTYENLIKHNILAEIIESTDEPSSDIVLASQTYESINLSTLNNGSVYYFPRYINYGRFIDSFNSTFILHFESGTSTKITIGSTGYYELSNITSNNKLIAIEVVNLVHTDDFIPTFEFEYSKGVASNNITEPTIGYHEIVYGATGVTQIIDCTDKKLSYVKIEVQDDTKNCMYTIDGQEFDLTSIRRVVWDANDSTYLPFTVITIGDGLYIEYYYEEA